LKDTRQSSTYPPHNGHDCCTADKALDGNPDSFSIPNEPNKGEWWEADFTEGAELVSFVRI
jgi:hypothetical protein